MKGLLGAFFAEVGIITYRSVRKGGVKVPKEAPLSLPLPANYTAACIIFGSLAILPDSLSPVTSLVGWGLVVATVLNLFDPTNPVHGVSASPSPKHEPPGTRLPPTSLA